MEKIRGPRGLQAALRRVNMATQNALEIARLGRLKDRILAPFKIAHQSSLARLRRSGGYDYTPEVTAPLFR